MKVGLIRAWPGRFEAIEVELEQGACVADALAAAGWDGLEEVAGIAVFGVNANPATLLQEGDRIELLRGLQMDPKEARRRRAAGRAKPR